MLKLFFRHYGCRNFSHSRLLKSAEKGKDVAKATESTQNVSGKVTQMDFVPSNFEKTLLLLSGRFKSKAEIPERITFETMDNARSRLRIRGSNILMVVTLFLCYYYVQKGKKRASEGDTITYRYLEYDKKILSEGEKEKSHQS